MGSHPINLSIRFLLELAALAALGVWGWQQSESWVRLIPALGMPIVAAGLWGVFRVPNDPGPASVAIPGVLRLILELAVFGFATWALYVSGYTSLGLIFGIVVVIHYAVSYDRIIWLVSQ
jgi:hypothetical protein